MPGSPPNSCCATTRGGGREGTRARPLSVRSARRPGAPRPLPLLRPRRPLGTLGGSRPPRWSASRRLGAELGARRGWEAGPRLFTSGSAAASRGPAGMCNSPRLPFNCAGSPRPPPRPVRWTSRAWPWAPAAARVGGAQAGARRGASACAVKGLVAPACVIAAAASRSSAAGVDAVLLCSRYCGGMSPASGKLECFESLHFEGSSGPRIEDGAPP